MNTVEVVGLTTEDFPQVEHDKYDKYGHIDEPAVTTYLDPVGAAMVICETRERKFDRDSLKTESRLAPFWKHLAVFEGNYVLAEIGEAIRDAHEATSSSDDCNPDYELKIKNFAAEANGLARADEARKYYGHQYAMRKLQDRELTNFEQVVFEYVTRPNPLRFKAREIGMLSKFYQMYTKDKEVDRCKELCTPYPTTYDNIVEFRRRALYGNGLGLGNDARPVEMIGGYVPLQAKSHMALILRDLEDGYMITVWLPPSPANRYLAASMDQNPYAKMCWQTGSPAFDVNGYCSFHSRGGNIEPYDR
jgi:hypothetical protein